jgi:hypothetical protein
MMSKKLSQAELQKIWDTSLLACWKSDVSGWAIATGFLKGIGKPDLAEKFNGKTKPTDEEFSEVKNLLVSYQLSRCLDKGWDGELEFRPSKTARAFVAEHCERLGTCLWSGKHTNEALLDSIDNFKWRRKGRAVVNARKNKNYKKRNSIVPVTLRARELDKRHDWDTVK